MPSPEGMPEGEVSILKHTLCCSRKRDLKWADFCFSVDQRCHTSHTGRTASSQQLGHMCLLPPHPQHHSIGQHCSLYGFYTQLLLSRFSHVRLFETPWTLTRQASLSMGFSRQDYWSGLSCPPPGESFQSRDRTHVSYVSCIGRWVLYH